MMRTPYVTMKRSAMCDKQKYSILANDLVRRMSNIYMEKEENRQGRLFSVD